VDVAVDVVQVGVDLDLDLDLASTWTLTGPVAGTSFNLDVDLIVFLVVDAVDVALDIVVLRWNSRSLTVTRKARVSGSFVVGDLSAP
jgi:hypothetical protein